MPTATLARQRVSLSWTRFHHMLLKHEHHDGVATPMTNAPTPCTPTSLTLHQHYGRRYPLLHSIHTKPRLSTTSHSHGTHAALDPLSPTPLRPLAPVALPPALFTPHRPLPLSPLNPTRALSPRATPTHFLGLPPPPRHLPRHLAQRRMRSQRCLHVRGNYNTWGTTRVGRSAVVMTSPLVVVSDWQ